MNKTKKIHNMNKKHTRKNKYTKKAHKLKKRVKQPNKRFRKTRSKRQRGGNPEEDQEKKDKRLFYAIGIYDYDKVENALNHGANVNAKNDAGDTPLIHAITTDNISYDTKYDMVQLLLQQPGIEFDINTIILAESQEEDDQDQGGIPALIESYLFAKNEIEENRYKTINEIKKMAEQKMREKLKFPSLKELACENLTLEQKKQIARCSLNINEGAFDPYSGGKRKTRKSKQKRRLN